MTLIFKDPPKTDFVGVISCSEKKRKGPSAARDMYLSQHFRFCLRYAEKNFNVWYILSANYGLLHPDSIIIPYDVKIKEVGHQQEYVELVESQWKLWIGDQPTICLLGAQYYRVVQRRTTLNLFGTKQAYPYCGEVFQKSLMVKWPRLTPNVIEEVRAFNEEKPDGVTV